MYSKRLIDIREEQNLKQYEVAKILNISASTYNNYENEYDVMPIKHLDVLSIYFNISIDYLFNFSKTRRYKQASNIDTILSGNRLRSFRKKIGLTQNELANFLNVDQTTISKYEVGDKIISTQFLYIICKKYKISADYLLGKVK